MNTAKSELQRSNAQRATRVHAMVAAANEQMTTRGLSHDVAWSEAKRLHPELFGEDAAPVSSAYNESTIAGLVSAINAP